MSQKQRSNGFLKKYLMFNEPEPKEEFILKENSFDKEEYAKKSMDSKNPKKTTLFKDKKSDNDKADDDNNGPYVSKKLKDNIEFLKERYDIPTNGDIVIREFDIVFKNKSVAAFIIFFDGMTDRTVINDNILQPLMILSNIEIKSTQTDITSHIRKHLLPHNQLKISESLQDMIDEINFGGCAIFVDGSNNAFGADVKGWEHRGVEKPNNELVIRGPQEGFNEILRSNQALIRKILKDDQLISEDLSIGKRNSAICSLMYIKDIANEDLVKEARRRLKSIDLDYLLDIGELEQLIEDSSFFASPQIIATERPDRVASALTEGRVAVLMSGNPYVLIVPSTFAALFHTPEDSYIRFPYANLIRFIRLIGLLFALLLPGLYIAVTNYHHEMIPTDLLLAIAATRETVPFPSIVEILIMELAFELIREAGIRIPGPIGPTLGIIGALILGQAAVAANIVSPILIIVVAVTGIGSFAIPNFSLGFSFRILRFGYIILGTLAGLLGITLGLFVHGVKLCSMKSFGVPFLAPFGPVTKGTLSNQITRGPIWKQERRPDYLNSKKDIKQGHISRKWTQNNDNEEEN